MRGAGAEEEDDDHTEGTAPSLGVYCTFVYSIEIE